MARVRVLVPTLVLLALASVPQIRAEPVACQREIARRTQQYAERRTQVLQKCQEDILRGTRPDPGPGGGLRLAACLADPAVTAALANATATLWASLDLRCGGADRTCSTVGDNDALADIGWPAVCPGFAGGSCTNTIQHCGDVAECLRCAADAATTVLVNFHYDARVHTADRVVERCQQTIAKEGLKAFITKMKALQSCENRVLKTPGFLTCPDCGAYSAMRKASQQAQQRICEACGGTNRACEMGGDDLSPAAVGLPPTCPDVAIPGDQKSCGGPIADMTAAAGCVECTTTFYGDCLDSLSLLARTPYPAQCAGAPPPPGPPPVSPAPPGTCTVFAAPDGRDANDGLTPTTPVTLQGASDRSQPGDTVCLLQGVYELQQTFYPRPGAPGAWITYRNYDGEARLKYVGACQGVPDTNTVHFFQEDAYVELRGLTIDANNVAANPVKCGESRHIRVINNTLVNGGSCGLGTKFCDYVTAIGNRIHHNGYDPKMAWCSGISYLSHQWSDQYQGFHSYIVGNVISGTVDESHHHTDGGGIILDQSSTSEDFSTANSPPVLVANNVVYQNGGRCIITFVITNGWIVNNTCYSNALDGRIGGGEIAQNKTKNTFVINNIAYAWNGSPPFELLNVNENIAYFRNAYFGGQPLVPPAVSGDPTQMVLADPLFVNPIVLDPTSDGQWTRAFPSDQITTQFHLQAGSRAIDAGIDPTTVPGIPPQIAADMAAYVFTDKDGIARPQGGGFDLGAYEHP